MKPEFEEGNEMMADDSAACSQDKLKPPELPVLKTDFEIYDAKAVNPRLFDQWVRSSEYAQHLFTTLPRDCVAVPIDLLRQLPPFGILFLAGTWATRANSMYKTATPWYFWGKFRHVKNLTKAIENARLTATFHGIQIPVPAHVVALCQDEPSLAWPELAQRVLMADIHRCLRAAESATQLQSTTAYHVARAIAALSSVALAVHGHALGLTNEVISAAAPAQVVSYHSLLACSFRDSRVDHLEVQLAEIDFMRNLHDANRASQPSTLGFWLDIIDRAFREWKQKRGERGV